jgi:hypothetical membrane protein
MRNKVLIYFGYLIPAIFWATNLICGIILGNYNHAQNLVSDLGAIGTKTQYLFSSGLILCGLLCILFVIKIANIAKQSRLNILPIILLLPFSISCIGAALFPLPLKVHKFFGTPVIFLIISPFLAFLLWRNKRPGILYFTIISFIIMSLGFLTYAPGILGSYHGLKQRVFHLGWSIWFCYLSALFLDLNKENSK